ncbi:MAG: class I SAM-dependent methyltransferase [Planctomycetes bacterium]|nr:class I SAM-dependent methyltransferase [Planctomycetota bacterium]
MTRPSLFPAPDFPDYALVDSGAGEKLERFGRVLLRRPDPQALWKRSGTDADWARADLLFVRESDRGGRWEPGPRASAEARRGEWTIGIGTGRFLVRPTPFKHVGVFPEQHDNWNLVARLARSFDSARPRLLNLFGYTGVASVLAAQVGYEVTHVDASRTSITWARENAAASGLPSDALRVLVDDALGFARREVRRAARYHVVLLDPPHYGRGPKGETWQFEDHVAELVGTLRELLHERALVVLSTYAIGCSPLTLENLLLELGAGNVEAGELGLAGPAGARVLPAGFCARWTRGVAAGESRA